MAATMATAGASLVYPTLFFYSTVYRSLPATAAARLRLDPRIMAWPQQQIRALLLLLLLSRRVQSHSFPIERGADVVVQKRTSIRFAYIYISRQQNTRTWGSWGKSVTPSSCPSFHCNQLPIRSFYIYFRRICWRSVLFVVSMYSAEGRPNWFAYVLYTAQTHPVGFCSLILAHEQ